MIQNIFAWVIIGLIMTGVQATVLSQSLNDKTTELETHPEVLNEIRAQILTAAAIEAANAIPEDPDISRLSGKWRVVSVEVDGEFSEAQVGQQVDDIISIGVKDETLQFG